MRANQIFAITLFLLAIFLSCKPNPEEILEELPKEVPPSDAEIMSRHLNLPATPYNYAQITLPQHFNAPPVRNADNTPDNNRVTDSGATLGRVLFYDKKLSRNQTKSCASCHSQENAFSDPIALSEGFEGGLTGRNSMGLSNARFYLNGHYFWDERANTLEDQTLMPIQDHVEMGMPLDTLTAKLQKELYYKILFKNAFGDTLVTSDRISLALAQFVRAMVSYQSKYDNGLNQIAGPPVPGLAIPGFTAQENLGLAIFRNPARGGCGGCHATDLFFGTAPFNNGLDAIITDLGLGAVTGNPADNGKFKVPSLRNIALTAPYMHDGRFETLEEVVEHYNSGIQISPTLDPRLTAPGGPNQQLRPRRLNLTEEEKSALVAFMNTLTDTVFTSDEKFSNPFK
ncbi:MAG: cytochrome c peroxidase [Bacteroidia bacterium]|nr:cytochrome c peroxidase [Bacteroidia bacterium]